MFWELAYRLTLQIKKQDTNYRKALGPGQVQVPASFQIAALVLKMREAASFLVYSPDIFVFGRIMIIDRDIS